MTTPAILVVAERSGDPQSALQKAAVLARHLGADLELFTCDADHAWAVRQRAVSADARLVVDACLAGSVRYLAALRGSVAARDLAMRSSAACAASLYEGLVAKVIESCPLLIVKGCAEASLRGPGVVLRGDDLRLMREPPAPLLLTRGRPWAPVPRVAVIDAQPPPAELSAEHDRRQRGLAEHIAQSCHGTFEMLQPQAGRHLSQWVAAQRIDLLALPARPGADSPRPEDLVGNLPCDLLVLPGAAQPAGDVVASAREVAIRTDPADR